MSLKTVVMLHDAAIELDGKPCATGIEKEGERTRKTITFRMIRKERKPTIQIVGHIFDGIVVTASWRPLAG